MPMVVTGNRYKQGFPQSPHFSLQTHVSLSVPGSACGWVVVVVVASGSASFVGDLDLPRDVSRDLISGGIVGDLDLFCDVSPDLGASSVTAIRLRAT